MRNRLLILFLISAVFIVFSKVNADSLIGVSLSTDKKSYRMGETMILVLRNETGEKIYTSMGIIELFVSSAERLIGDLQWEEVAFSCLPPYGECDVDASPPAPLVSGATEQDKWVMGYDPISKARTIVKPGTYRLVGSYQFRSEGSVSEEWSWRDVYSNEFKVEK